MHKLAVLLVLFFPLRLTSSDPNKLSIFSSKLIPEGYNEDEPPDGSPDPKTLDLIVDLDILSFNDFVESKHSLKVSIAITSQWVEPRLDTSAFVGVADPFIPRDEQIRYWTPYFMFYDIKGGNLLDNNLKFPWLMINSETKVVRYKQIFKLDIECKMKMDYYPLDRQKCSLEFRTFQPEEFGKWINIDWDSNKTKDDRNEVPVFSFLLTRTERSVVRNITRPVLRLTFLFERQVLPLLVTLYMPSMLIVCSTFISFWIRTSAVPARVGLIVTAMLAMLQLMINGHKDLPPVSIVTALDIWLFTCVSYVFASLFEFAIAYNFDLKAAQVKNRVPVRVWIPIEDLKKEKNWIEKLKSMNCSNIDHISRLVFPISFAIFTMSYFIHYKNI